VPRKRPYTPATVRLVEIRLLDGPNIYRLEPAVKLEVAVGRRRTWYGQRLPGRHAVVRLGRPVRPTDAPSSVAELAVWVRTLHRRALSRTVPVTIHRTSEPGHWIVAYPWQHYDEAETIARAALRLTDEFGERLLARAMRSISSAGGRSPEWVTDAERRLKVISVSGTNGKSTTARMLTHICRAAGMRVGTTTTDGVLVDEQMVEPGDFTGPAGARAVFAQTGLDAGVLETARGGILLRGLGYESNDASVLTNISADHLDLQGVHTLPELAEVKSVICRVTRAHGAVALNADDPLVAAVARYVSAPVFLFTATPGNARVRRHLERGGTAFVVEGGVIVERSGSRDNGRAEIVPLDEVPATLLGLARHNVSNTLAATAGARALGIDRRAIAQGLRDFLNTAELMPGRMNLYTRGDQLVMIDYAHNEAGLAALLDTADGLLGRRGKRRAKLTVIIGTAGDRPDDSLRAIGTLGAERGDRIAIKESLTFLRGRTRAGVIGEFMAGARAAGASTGEIPVYVDELEALTAELARAGSDGPFVIVEMCHEQRPEVRDFLLSQGFAEVADPRALESFRH
jgi:cyanophycin synthetase